VPARLIRWSIENRLLVLIASVLVGGWGWLSVQQIALDAIRRSSAERRWIELEV